MDLLISKGIHSGVLSALMLVSSHYDGMDYDAIGLGYSSRKSDAKIFAIGNSATHGVEVLESKVSAATIHL